MNSIATKLVSPLFAADETGALRSIEYSLPEGPLEWTFYAGGFVVAFILIIVFYLRDTREVSVFWKLWLMTLRFAVLAGLIAIAINPQERTQKMSYRPSRVAVLVDRSLSMRYPAEKSTASAANQPTDDEKTRAEAVQELLADTSLINELRENHDVSIYTFDSTLNGPHQVYRSKDARNVAATQPESATTGQPGESIDTEKVTIDWNETLRPVGLETRLGETLLDLIRQVSGQTLSGIVVVTDGGSNAGIEASAANEAAKAAKVRLISVGVGSTEQPINVQIASIQAPTDVHLGDPFEISAFIQGQGLARRSIQVELLTRPENEKSEPTQIETREITLFEDGIPVEVKFDRDPSEAGAVEYFIRVRPIVKVQELSEDDNERRKTINVLDRKTRVLLVAGGPMRDYRFVRNMLYRHSAVELDVWLQTADPGAATSQESDNLLIEFPDSREKLFNYDVVVAFDPDWRNIPEESLEMLREWVFAQAGGLILVAGDVNTRFLADAGADELKSVLELYPVVLNSYLMDFLPNSRNQQPWPIEFTRSGTDAGFLQLADDPISSSQKWQEFTGIYGCYPTGGSKAGATVFAHFSDPRAQTEYGQPILMASQFYGSGRTLYVGTSELWRLRSVDEEFYDRLWTKTVREVGQARLRRGTNRGMLLLERNQYILGQTVRVRAHLLDPQFKPMSTDAVTMEIFDPNGKPLVPPARMVRDQHRPGQYIGDFRASIPGTYHMELPIPESNDELSSKIDVVLPNLETDNSRLNAQLLRSLVQDTGGTYLRLDAAEKEIPNRLPNQGEEFLVDERLRTLWDRDWVMYLLVGLLSLEWLTRKLLKLA